MVEQLAGRKYFPLCLFLISVFVYLFNSHGISIYILDEAKNAGCAREMLEQGNFFVPTFNYVLRTDKPPLHYFFMILSYRMFGVNPFAARFFSAVFGALTILITFIFTRKFAGIKTAFGTVVCLLASLHLTVQFHFSVPDPYLVFFFTATLFLFYAALDTKKWQHAVLMYVAMGLGTLSKGPVAILLPGLIFLLYLLFARLFSWKNIIALKPFWGVLIVLAISAPWFVVNGLQTHGEWTRGFFLKHNVGRFSGAMEGHGGFFLLPFLFVFAGLFPFAMFLPGAVKNALKNRKDNFSLFCLIAAFTVVIFFSLSKTKLINYTVPSYPFFAVLLGGYFANRVQFFRQLRIGYLILLFIAASLPIVAFFVLKGNPSPPELTCMVPVLAIFPIGIATAWFLRKNIWKFLVAIAVSSLLTVLGLLAFVLPVIDRQNPVSQSMNIVKNCPVVYYRKFDPAYSFYLEKEIKEVGLDVFESFFEEHPDGIIISDKKKLKDVDLPGNCSIIFSGKNRFENTTTVLIAVDD